MKALLAALLVGAVVLIVVEARRPPDLPRIANPCLERRLPAGGGEVQRLILVGLDRAACRLGTSRETLVLSAGGGAVPGGPRWNRQTVDRAVRAGLIGAIDEAARRGDIPSFARPLLEEIVRRVPIDLLVRGALALTG